MSRESEYGAKIDSVQQLFQALNPADNQVKDEFLMRGLYFAAATCLRGGYAGINLQEGLQRKFRQLQNDIVGTRSLEEKKSHLQHFCHQLIELLQPAPIEDKKAKEKFFKRTAKEIAHAETYIVNLFPLHNGAQQSLQLTDVCEFKQGDETAISYEINTERFFMAESALAYMQAVSANDAAQPGWFKALPEWEQDFLRQQTNHAANASHRLLNLDNENNEESIAILISKLQSAKFNIDDIPEEALTALDKAWAFSSGICPTARYRPGAANTGRDVLRVGDRETVLYHMGVATPYGIKSKAERQEVADAAVCGHFDRHCQQFAKDYAKRWHGDSNRRPARDQVVEIPVLMESLLTPAAYEVLAPNFADNNTEMLRYRDMAIANLQKRLKENHSVNVDGVTYKFNIINNNQPLNGRRGHVSLKWQRKRHKAAEEILTAVIATYSGTLRKTRIDRWNNKVAKIKPLVAELRECVLGAKKIPMGIDLDRLNVLYQKIAELDKENATTLMQVMYRYIQAWQAGPDFRDTENHALYLAGCESLLLQEVGGAVILNCKSSKDRAGLAKSQNIFMRAHLAKRLYIPIYGSQFTNGADRIMRKVVTRVPGEIAHIQSPGARGIKDEPLKLVFRIGHAFVSMVSPAAWLKTWRTRVPYYFRKAKHAKSIGKKIGYGLLGFFTALFPMLVEPVAKLVQRSAMTPTAIAKTVEFKRKKAYANTNKFKAKKRKSVKITAKQQRDNDKEQVLSAQSEPLEPLLAADAVGSIVGNDQQQANANVELSAVEIPEIIKPLEMIEPLKAPEIMSAGNLEPLLKMDEMLQNESDLIIQDEALDGDRNHLVGGKQAGILREDSNGLVDGDMDLSAIETPVTLTLTQNLNEIFEPINDMDIQNEDNFEKPLEADGLLQNANDLSAQCNDVDTLGSRDNLLSENHSSLFKPNQKDIANDHGAIYMDQRKPLTQRMLQSLCKLRKHCHQGSSKLQVRVLDSQSADGAEVLQWQDQLHNGEVTVDTCADNDAIPMRMTYKEQALEKMQITKSKSSTADPEKIVAYLQSQCKTELTLTGHLSPDFVAGVTDACVKAGITVHNKSSAVTAEFTGETQTRTGS